MRNIIKITVMLAIVLMGFGACRNGKAAQEILQVVKKYSGKMFKSAEKDNFNICYSDDVVRNIEFVKVTCSACEGCQVDSRGNVCEESDGTEYVYKLKTK